MSTRFTVDGRVDEVVGDELRLVVADVAGLGPEVLEVRRVLLVRAVSAIDVHSQIWPIGSAIMNSSPRG